MPVVVGIDQGSFLEMSPDVDVKCLLALALLALLSAAKDALEEDGSSEDRCRCRPESLLEPSEYADDVRSISLGGA